MTTDIKMPRLGVNDDYVTLSSWLVKDGNFVAKGQIIATIETSKETSEITATVEGTITLMVKAGEDIPVNGVVASIGDEEVSCHEKPKDDALPTHRMTDKAKKIAEEHHVDLSLLPTDRLIKEKDILPFIYKNHTLAETKNNELILYGGGGFSEIAIDILKVTHAYHVHGIVDMKYPEMQEVMGIPVIGNDDVLKTLFDNGYRKIFNGVGARGSQYWRRPPYDKLKKYGFDFPNIVHAKAIIEPSVSFGEGNIICAGAIIGAGAKIGSNCVINAGAIISHDSIISDHCHIASGTVLAGIVTVGENTLIGQNVTVYSRIRIGSNVIIENGCSVFKDVPDNTIVRYRDCR